MRAPQRLWGQVDAVVIGASAGGIEALMQILPALEAPLQAPILVVLHQPRERSGRLTDVFAAVCAVPVREVEDKEAVRPGVVYFAAPDYHLLIDPGPRLALSADEPVHLCRPSIDVLFESAADLYGARLLGIILSGSNRDGADGLLAVRRAGGIAIVQHPDSAQAETMPLSALSRDAADFVLALPEIAAVLRSLTAPVVATQAIEP
jgi:two-component system, chemotaxis family, protein-glutamate methylesterase/glutaminase